MTALDELVASIDALGASALSAAIVAAFAMLSAALVLAILRLLRGPSLPDRIVSLELVASLFVGVVAVTSIATRVSAYLDVAIALILVAFLGAVVLAQFIERRRTR